MKGLPRVFMGMMGAAAAVFVLVGIDVPSRSALGLAAAYGTLFVVAAFCWPRGN